MPELPEVEVTRRSFASEITGAQILAAVPGKPLRWPLGCSPARLVGQRVQGVRRRVVYVSIYELIAIAVVTVGLSRYTGQDMGHSGVMAVVSSAVAVVWNILFNTLFERWEARQAVRGRSLRRRVAHAIGFEGGLVFTLVPLFAWWFDISLWEALLMDLGLIVFFLCYTFVFSWVFDKLFGLPASALGSAALGAVEK